MIWACLNHADQFYLQVNIDELLIKIHQLKIIQSIYNDIQMQLFHFPVAFHPYQSHRQYSFDHPVLLHQLCSFLMSVWICSNLLLCIWCIINALPFKFSIQTFRSCIYDDASILSFGRSGFWWIWRMYSRGMWNTICCQRETSNPLRADSIFS